MIWCNLTYSELIILKMTGDAPKISLWVLKLTQATYSNLLLLKHKIAIIHLAIEIDL